MACERNQNTIEPVLEQLEHLAIKEGEALGSLIAVELRMRLICQLSENVRIKLKGHVKKDRDQEYWNCKLCHIEAAILEAFGQNLSENEIQELKFYRQLRNELAHANFVELMKLLNIQETGREILPSGKRTNLDVSDIQGAIVSVDSSPAFGRVRSQAGEVSAILDKLLRQVANT